MLGLPGDFTPPSRFVRAVAFVNTMIPAKDAADAVNAASVMLNNFDIPKGLVREGSAEDFHLGYTQWSVIADMSHKVYYYWTMYDRRMRSVDLSKLDFGVRPFPHSRSIRSAPRTFWTAPTTYRTERAIRGFRPSSSSLARSATHLA
jgi:penicillin V acylase-like amidase (Ntn superfamily)